ncbi:MAG TPA: helix-turn-helix domain-containing protein [Streptosporangiaceae bacterium]
MTIIVRRPAPPLAGLVRAIVYQAGEQPRTSVQRILPDPEPSVWTNLNRDEFRSLRGPGHGRIDRVTRALAAQSGADWAAVAAGHGYSDQSHLVDEFRDLAGVTPAEYLRSRIDGPNHLWV